jgi:hypothetical protein
MPVHKFIIGQKVRFRFIFGLLARRDETFVVSRQLPETGGVFQYQIECEIDGHNGSHARISSPIYRLSRRSRRCERPFHRSVARLIEMRQKHAR